MIQMSFFSNSAAKNFRIIENVFQQFFVEDVHGQDIMSNYIVASVSRGNRRHRSQYKIRITVALVFRRVADRKRRDGALLNRLKLSVLAGIYVQGKVNVRRLVRYRLQQMPV